MTKTFDQILAESRALEEAYRQAMPKITHPFKVGDKVTVINPEFKDDYMFTFIVDEIDGYGNMIVANGDYFVELSYADVKLEEQ